MHSDYSKLTSFVGLAQLVGSMLGPGFSIDSQLSIPSFVPECTPSPGGTLRIMANSFCIGTCLKYFMFSCMMSMMHA